MRFNKKSRKIRIKKKKQNLKARASFWGYAALAVLLLGVFYFFLYASHQKGLRRIRQEKIQDDFDRICAAAILYFQEHGTFPSTGQGLAGLVGKAAEPIAAGNPGIRTGILERVPLDPWRNPYEYRGSRHADEITLICWGADGRQGGNGEAADVVRKGCRSTALPVR